MVQLPVIRPVGSPSCWGQMYQDGDYECGQCRFNESCRKEVLRGAMSVPVANQIPVPPRAPTWPAPVPASPVPAFRPAPVPPPPLPQHPVTQYQHPIPVPVAPLYATGYQQQYQQPMQPFLPQAIPDPMQPWLRPGVSAPPYYFNQYPGEPPLERFAKNLLLRAIAAVAQELLGFFIQWTWPPGRSNNKQG